MTNFPEAFVDTVADYFSTKLPNFITVKRPTRVMDPTDMVGVFVQRWRPDQRTMEMAGGPQEPTIGNYDLRIQIKIVSADEEIGRSQMARAGKILRAVVYRDAELRGNLLSLSETYLGYVERVRRIRVLQQEFQGPGQAAGMGFMYVTSVEMQIETETSRA